MAQILWIRRTTFGSEDGPRPDEVCVCERPDPGGGGGGSVPERLEKKGAGTALNMQVSAVTGQRGEAGIG